MESDKTVIVIAGHDLTSDPGAIAYDGTTEAQLTHNLRETVILYLEQMRQSTLRFNGTKMEVIEDNDRDKLNQTINQVNHFPNAVGIDLHFNYNHPTASGVEIFVSPNTNEANKKRATWLVNQVSMALGIPVRKAVGDRYFKYSNESQHSSLGILDQTKPSMMLLEVCFMNQADLTKYRANINKVAYLIAEALLS